MKNRILPLGAALAALLFICIGLPAWCAAGSIQLSMMPSPIARGEPLNVAVLIDNATAHALADTTLFAPLPVGVDQWAAEIRMDGGVWEPYPANGLIELPVIPATGQLNVEILTPIESGSPGTLIMTAQWLNSTGVLSDAADWINVLPSVDAGPDVIANLGDSIMLMDPSASDGGDVIAHVVWTDHGAGGSFDDMETLNPIYTPPMTSGVVELSLTVTDSDDGEAADSLRLRINAFPTVTLGGDLEASEGSSLSIGQASASDPDGWLASAIWDDGGAGGTFLPSNDVIDPLYLVPELAGCEDGLIVLTLVVTDEWGAVGSDSLDILVINTNQLPLVYCPDDRQVSAEELIELTAIATDVDGWIDAQYWEQVAGVDIDLVMGSQQGHVSLNVPVLTTAEDVTLRFTAIDNCGGESWDDVVLTIIPEDRASPSPVVDGAMRVDLDLFDARGLPLSPFDVPPNGDPITVKLTVINTGSSMLNDITAGLRDGESIVLLSNTLDPWRSTTGVGERTQMFRNGVDIEAVVQAKDESGQWITASDTFRFLGQPTVDDAAIALEKSASSTESAVGESIIYTFRVANVGSSQLDGITLVDNQLGWIDLPSDDLMVGENVEIEVATVIREVDLPGPVASQATVIGFSQQGVRVEASASTYVDLVDAADGGGGTAAGQVQRTIVISEVAWAGSTSNPSAEWVELANIGSETADLSGWTLSWYEKAGTVPPSSQWHSIELSGVIQPLEETTRSEKDLLFSSLSDGLWSIQDRLWQTPGASNGYMLLERGDDDVVATIRAGVVYGDDADPYFQLPDTGAVLLLHDAAGNVVDSANAQYPGRTGWPAGNLVACATMERIHLDQGDYDENWQTTSGVMTYGVDGSGRGLLATAGMANSFALALVVDAATASMAGVPTSTGISVPIPTPINAGPPAIQVSVLASGGGGGTASSPAIATTRKNGALRMTVDLEEASQGTYFVWITSQNGETLLLPLKK